MHRNRDGQNWGERERKEREKRKRKREQDREKSNRKGNKCRRAAGKPYTSPK